MDTGDYLLAMDGEGEQAATWRHRPHRLVYDLCNEIERLQEALTPSADTKAAYIGEFTQPSEIDGVCDVTISWTATKDIMAAIRTRAAEAAGKEGE